MPRIRNLKKLKFFRPFEDVRFRHIDGLFSETIDWKLIETHWKDLLRVVLSIKAGKVSSATLLRKLSNYSKKNRLYKAFRELGRVVRTVFLLEYISNLELRVTTNKAEAYNAFSKWLYVADLTTVLRELTKEGYGFDSKAAATLSPYMTSHIKRFGDYINRYGQYTGAPRAGIDPTRNPF